MVCFRAEMMVITTVLPRMSFPHPRTSPHRGDKDEDEARANLLDRLTLFLTLEARMSLIRVLEIMQEWLQRFDPCPRWLLESRHGTPMWKPMSDSWPARLTGSAVLYVSNRSLRLNAGRKKVSPKSSISWRLAEPLVSAGGSHGPVRH